MAFMLKSYWGCIILLAILSNTLIFYWPSNRSKNLDAESAIKRAKTDSCKSELRSFSSINSLQDTKSYLKRSCGLDSNQQRIVKVGCALNSTESLIRLENQVTNLSNCLEVCFNYGHSHGGYNVASEQCFCGDDLSQEGNGLGKECYGQDWMDWYRIDNGIYRPNGLKPLNLVGSNETSQIKIAFLLILSGRDVMQVKRLLRNIYSSAHIYYIHVDKRDNYLFDSLKILEGNHKNIILTRSRFNTIWGGPSLLRMLVDAIGSLSHYDWDYLINLSESDFPIKPIKKLEAYLSSDVRWIYLRTHNIKGHNFIKKQGLDRNFYQCEDHVWRLGWRSLPSGIVYSGGSDWFALPRDFCLYITQHQNDAKSLVSPLLKIYNNTLLPAESFFHTLALNSEFCDRFVDKNLRVANWHRQKGCKCQHQEVVDWCGCSPLVYRMSDLDKLRQIERHDDIFFARKFDPTISSSIINALESQLTGIDYEVDNHHSTGVWLNVYDHSEKLDSPRSFFDIRQQFGSFALNLTNLPESLELSSIHLYFNEDKFVGLIFQYCNESNDCYQFLVEKKTEAHLNYQNADCSKSNGARLSAIEVGHGFDTGERIFRDYRPLSIKSDIVVYHEWLLSEVRDEKQKISTEGVRFFWINPQGSLEVHQKVRFKELQRPRRGYYAHRLAVTKPLMPGLWTLLISNQNHTCFEYKFLVFGESSFDEFNINQAQFNRFYRISDTCSLNNVNNTADEKVSCAHKIWSPSTTNLGLQSSSLL